jgi:hypothetical protein
MLVPLIDTPKLFPVLDTERQRLNILRRFDWSFPPPNETTDLPDVSKPDWEAYSLPVASVRNMNVSNLPLDLILPLNSGYKFQEETRREHVIARIGEAMDAIDDLEGRGARRSAAGLCPELWEQVIASYEGTSD